MELQNASCASGAAGAAAQAIYAGKDPGAGTLTDDQIKNRAELIGGIAGFFASEGKGENVSTAASIARSGAENNYLKHDQILSLEEALRECDADTQCLQDTEDEYADLSEENRNSMLSCTVPDCWAEHLAEIRYAELALRDVSKRIIVRDEGLDFIANRVASFAREERDASITLNSVITPLNGQAFDDWGEGNCGGLHDAACMASYQRHLNADNLLDSGVNAALLVGGGGLAGAALRASIKGAIAVCGTNATCLAGVLGTEVGAEVLAEVSAGGAAVHGGAGIAGDILGTGARVSDDLAEDVAGRVAARIEAATNSRPAHLTSHPDAHTVERHGPQVTDQQLETRALTGVAPDGSTLVGNKLPPLSSAFHSESAMLRADSVMRGQPLRNAIAADPTATTHRFTFDVGEDVGRGYKRLGSSNPNNIGRSGPPERVDGLTHATVTVTKNPQTGVWETITMFPALSK